MSKTTTHSIPRFQQTQYDFASHLRDPLGCDAPRDVEDRRMKIYRDLVYNNIETFISTGFPVLRCIINDDHWHGMVREFIHYHQSHTPYFSEIGQEFIRYLQDERKTHSGDPEFMLELAHYEWVELALDLSAEEIPDISTRTEPLLSSIPVVSPLAWRLSYQYPVHKLGPEYQPHELPEQGTFLMVYRNRADEVKFLEINAVTAHLLQLLEGDELRVRDALLAIAEQLGSNCPEALLKGGEELVDQLYALEILL
ncbi:MAG: putative DNA-binding domain-containing protein [Porticoccus sp.]|nr:putative DNA-binding domain-containing protein [Porticoccus sp.]